MPKYEEQWGDNVCPHLHRTKERNTMEQTEAESKPDANGTDRDRCQMEGRVINSSAAESDVTIGDYVFASRWPDCDWNDPWAVGFVSFIGKNFIEVDDGDGGSIGGVGRRGWRHCMKITGCVGAKIVAEYPRLEGTNFVTGYAAKLFDLD